LKTNYLYFREILGAFLCSLVISSSVVATNSYNDDLLVGSSKKLNINRGGLGSLAGLPAELLYEIFCYFRVSELRTISLVSPTFNSQTSGEHLWYTLFNRDKRKKYGHDPLNRSAPVISWKKYYKLMNTVQDPLAAHKLLTSRKSHLIDLKQLVEGTFKTTSSTRYYLIGLFYTTQGQYKKALKAFDKAAQIGDKDAEKEVFSTLLIVFRRALSIGSIDQQIRIEDDHFNDLKERGKKGNKEANEWVNYCIYSGEFGQERRSNDDRLKDLKKRKQNGDKDARWHMEFVEYFGGLGKKRRSNEEIVNHLFKCLHQVGPIFQERVCHALYHGEGLGQEERSEEDRWSDLSMLAKHEILPAKEYRNLAIYLGKLGQGERSDDSRYNELSWFSQQEDLDARSWMYLAIAEGTLGQETRSEEKRPNYFLDCAQGGDPEAQYWVNEFVHKKGKLGQGSLSKKKRFQYLSKRSQQGDLDAQGRVVRIISRGKLGQGKKDITPDETPELENMAEEYNQLFYFKILNRLLSFQ